MTVKCKITIAALVTSAAIAVTLLLAPAHRALAQAKTPAYLSQESSTVSSALTTTESCTG